MSFIFITTSLAVVVIYILWVLFKPKKNQIKKKVAHKKKPALKNKTSAKKKEAQASLAGQIRRKREEQMKKDPEAISQVLRLWLNEK